MWKRLGMVAVGALLAGCASGPGTGAADVAATAGITSATVRNTVWQDELGIVRWQRVFAGFHPLTQGLLDARMQQHRAQELRRTVGPLFAAIDDVDVRGQLEQGIGQGVRRGLGTDNVRVTTTPRLLEAPERDELRAGLQPDAALVDVVTTYQLSLNSLHIEMESSAKLFRAGRGAPAYVSRYYYQSAPVSGSVSAYALWAENGGARYRQAIADGVDQIGRMIALDLAHANPPAPARSMTFALRNGDSDATSVTGVVLQESGARVILRAGDGNLYSFAK